MKCATPVFVKISILALSFLVLPSANASKLSNKSRPAPRNEIQTIDTALAAMKSRYEGVKTFTAEFTQLQKNVALERTKESKGRIYIMRPDKFRWETLEPDASILCGNGHRVWYYTPPFRDGEKGQVMIRAAQDVQSKLAIELMVGGGDFKKTFDYRRVEAGHFRLNPLKPAGDIDHIELFLENQTNLVYRIELISSGGNASTITLKNVELGPKLNDNMFTFKVPAHTEVIQ